ncbi:MAG: DUF6527 family protein [Burkholderiales bacterium]
MAFPRQKNYRRIPSATSFARVVEVATQAEADIALREPKVIAVVENPSLRKWVKFFCPCGCREVIALNLMRHIHPCWRIRFDRRGRISVWPSVWRLNGCRSHFFLTANEVRFIERYGISTKWSLTR